MARQEPIEELPPLPLIVEGGGPVVKGATITVEVAKVEAMQKEAQRQKENQVAVINRLLAQIEGYKKTISEDAQTISQLMEAVIAAESLASQLRETHDRVIEALKVIRKETAWADPLIAPPAEQTTISEAEIEPRQIFDPVTIAEGEVREALPEDEQRPGSF